MLARLLEFLPDGRLLGGGHLADAVESLLQVEIEGECAVDIVSVFGQSVDLVHDISLGLKIIAASLLLLFGPGIFLLAYLRHKAVEYLLLLAFGHGEILRGIACFGPCRAGIINFDLTERCELLAQARQAVALYVGGVFGEDVSGCFYQLLCSHSLGCLCVGGAFFSGERHFVLSLHQRSVRCRHGVFIGCRLRRFGLSLRHLLVESLLFSLGGSTLDRREVTHFHIDRLNECK